MVRELSPDSAASTTVLYLSPPHPSQSRTPAIPRPITRETLYGTAVSMRVIPSNTTIFVQASCWVQDPPIQTFYGPCSLHFGKFAMISLSCFMDDRFDEHHGFPLMVVQRKCDGALLCVSDQSAVADFDMPGPHRSSGT